MYDYVDIYFFKYIKWIWYDKTSVNVFVLCILVFVFITLTSFSDKFWCFFIKLIGNYGIVGDVIRSNRKKIFRKKESMSFMDDPLSLKTIIHWHLACWHIKMCTLIGYTIRESLVKIQHYRHECSSIMYENTYKKYDKINGRAITCSYIWHIDTLKCVY